MKGRLSGCWLEDEGSTLAVEVLMDSAGTVQVRTTWENAAAARANYPGMLEALALVLAPAPWQVRTVNAVLNRVTAPLFRAMSRKPR